MGKIAFVFAGQGSQYIGMGKDFYESFPIAMEIYKKAEEILGYDLYDLSVNGEIETLSKTEYAQPAIFVLSLIGYEILKSKNINPSCIAGFSLGEISALCASGYYGIEDGLMLVKKRAEAMQKASEEKSGVMYAVLNVDSEEISRVCENTQGYVIPVNFNSPVQTVIAGEEEAVKKAVETLSSYERAKCIKLNVSSAFHSEFMKKASDEFYEGIEAVNFKKGDIPVYSDITSELLAEENIREYLKKQMISPVKWVQIIKNMIADGVDTFIELGSGKTLSGLIKKTDKSVRCFNVEDLKTLELLDI